MEQPRHRISGLHLLDHEGVVRTAQTQGAVNKFSYPSIKQAQHQAANFVACCMLLFLPKNHEPMHRAFTGRKIGSLMFCACKSWDNFWDFFVKFHATFHLPLIPTPPFGHLLISHPVLPRWPVIIKMPTLFTFSGTRSIGRSASRPVPQEFAKEW